MSNEQHTHNRPNRLINERSPYLQQHAYNPVDWFPWGEEAFETARKEGKPIFLSIGYSTCHWCHVMERESFENPETAALMNRLFVNIKVDREERPDVDQVYMAAAQALTGQGGWPLSAWLTPELKPYYVGTYFPPRSMYGRPSFGEALAQLHNAWINERDRVESSAEAITEAVRKGSELSDAGLNLSPADEATPKTDADGMTELARLTFDRIARTYDAAYGGFGSRPKFPRPVVPDFLLRCYERSANRRGLDMALHTLRKMAGGGMYDQLGGGFARYSVDEEWRVPHFEKMRYDQGQLLALYADAYGITGEPDFADTIRGTVAYLERDMLHEGGAFYSAEDADSEGEEGKFYVWSRNELEEILPDPTTFDIFCRYYGITGQGNFEHGLNVLHTSDSPENIARSLGITADEVKGRLAEARGTLFTHREGRVRPHRDEKILTAWNGLVISGLARASATLNEPHFARLASGAADFVLTSMVRDGVLFRRWKEGEIKVEGHLDDYAFFIAGLIDLYQATFDPEHLAAADRLTDEAIRRFADEEGGGFFQTEGKDPNVLVRAKGDYDGAEPSGNSVMAMNLVRLGRLLEDERYREHAERTVRLFHRHVLSYPEVMPLMVSAEMLLAAPARQIVIAAAPEDPDGFRRLAQQARAPYHPGTVLAAVPADGPTEWMESRTPMIAAMRPAGGKSVAYVCEDFICHAPVTDLESE